MNIGTLIGERFKSYADDFELTFVDDDWKRLEKYFSCDAIYSTVGLHKTRTEGRKRLLDVLKHNISNFDRKCDSRTLTTVDGPHLNEQILTRTWRSEFTLQGADDLVIEGHEKAVYVGKHIVLLEEEIFAVSAARMAAWLERYGANLLRS